MASVKQSDIWLEQTRERLDVWGAHLKSIQLDRVSYSSHASFLSVPGETAPIPENEVAERIESILCRIKFRREIYRALYLFHYLGHSNTQAAITMNVSEKTYRLYRLQGEVMVATYWDAENETQASLKKQVDLVPGFS